LATDQTSLHLSMNQAQQLMGDHNFSAVSNTNSGVSGGMSELLQYGAQSLE